MILFAVLATLAAPAYADNPGQFDIAGNTGVNAHAMFLGQNGNLYIIDRTEANPLKAPGANGTNAPSEFDPRSRTAKAMTIKSNTFCSGGSGLGDGRWFNTGGNGPQGQGSTNGLRGTRFLTPGGQWEDITDGLNNERWYPSVETLPDGDAIVIGGSTTGDFVNGAQRNNPTYEVSRCEPVDSLVDVFRVRVHTIVVTAFVALFDLKMYSY
jgi:hypothetical protein